MRPECLRLPARLSDRPLVERKADRAERRRDTHKRTPRLRLEVVADRGDEQHALVEDLEPDARCSAASWASDPVNAWAAEGGAVPYGPAPRPRLPDARRRAARCERRAQTGLCGWWSARGVRRLRTGARSGHTR